MIITPARDIIRPHPGIIASNAYKSPARSPLGSMQKSNLGALRMTDGNAAPTGQLFCCGAFGNKIAVYDPDLDDWTDVGDSLTTTMIAMCEHDGKIYLTPGQAAGTFVVEMTGFDTLSTFAGPFGVSPDSIVSYDGNLIAAITGGFAVQKWNGGSSWSNYGTSSTPNNGLVRIDQAGDLWCGGRRYEAGTWVDRSTWSHQAEAGSPVQQFGRRIHYAAFMRINGSSTKYIGLYEWNDTASEWQTTQATKHNIVGAESVTGQVYEGGDPNDSGSWTNNPADALGESFGNSTFLNAVDVGGLRYFVIAGGGLGKDGGGYMVKQDSIPLSTVDYMIPFGGNLLLCGTASGTGAIQEYDGASYSFKGTDDTFPNGRVYDLLELSEGVELS